MKNNIKVPDSDLVSVKPKKYLYVPPMIYLDIIKNVVANKVFTGGPDLGYSESAPS